MEQKLPFVSIIIPCRNEKNFISKCLDFVLENDYPKDKIEMFIVDGMSTDGTREIINDYIKKYPFICLLDNPKRITPVALNIGIKEAKTGIIIRMDAHATYKTDYIFKCATYLEKYGADDIGGIWIIKPQDNTAIGRGIAKSMSSFLGTGDAYYKIGSEKLKIVDTVPFGCYRKEVFDKIGFFNENLKRSQDMEFNIRLKKAGGKIYLFPEIVGYYYARSKIKEFLIHNFEDGIWAVYPLKFVKIPFRPRHYVPLAFVSGLTVLFLAGLFFKPFLHMFFGFLLFYLLVVFYSAIKVSLKEKDKTYLFSLPIALIVRHFTYGFGSVFGIIKLLI